MAPTSNQRTPRPFLVEWVVGKIGGGTVRCLDVVEAVSETAARDKALNYFTLGGQDREIVIGSKIVFTSAVSDVDVNVIAVLDMADECNAVWAEALKRTRQWERGEIPGLEEGPEGSGAEGVSVEEISPGGPS